ncbi:Crooked neck-like protein 1 [Myotis brandtii]|uniref:Crooked neck-like protein 1 n=1 Tax=Myotis brandtii TaxID=109478 RepID=S7N6I4_MYOBR|nr:Crooked neck-like protein 1 [Myotis brandtii]
MEMKNRQVNHARNIWDQAITLPRVNQFWYKYTYMEEMLGNVAGAQQVFERWMEWQPEEQAWHSYINFELRYKEVDQACTIYERFVLVHPDVKNWIKYARSEEKHGYFAHARKVYERAVEFFGDEHMDERLYVAFAKFEENRKESERVRVIYKYALDRISKQEAQELFKNYTIFEKKFGDRWGIEDIIVSKRRFQYEEEVKANPHNYDAWFDYLRLVESDAEAETVREVYERAIANVPPIQEKRHWKRYIYLWVNYALYEELEAKIYEEANKTMRNCEEKEERFMLLESWRNFEDDFGTTSDKERVDKLMPKKVKKRRKVQADDGSDAGWEEYYDYIFPEDAANQLHLKLLALAKLWKKQQQEKEAAEQDPDKDIDESES